ncbi:MAG: HAMP domain-containing protein, partial [Nitrospinota bacterium]
MVKSLQHRLVLYLLVPVAVILLGLAFFGFFSIRQHLLQAWEESALLKLERAADTIDRRLNRLKSWIERFHATGQNPNGSAIQEWLLQQLQEEEGVNRVTLTWTADPPSARSMPMMPGTDRPGGMGSRRGMMRFHRGRIAEVSPPHYDAQAGQETLSLISHLTDETGRTLGTLEVVIRFDALIAGILTRGWGEGTVAGLVDDTGRYLAHTDPQQKGRQLGDTGDPVEKATLAALQTQRVGTLFGSGHPPKWVSGFYRLQAAPWTVVLFAPGQTVLAPIIRFLISYVLIGLGGIGGILLLIRLVVGPIVSSIRVLSQAAEQVAQGRYSVPLPVNSRDEIGQLIHSFHT